MRAELSRRTISIRDFVFIVFPTRGSGARTFRASGRPAINLKNRQVQERRHRPSRSC